MPAQAIDAVMSGHNVVVSTSTASGKSLCYVLPVLEALTADPNACAIFMFPTKALAQACLLLMCSKLPFIAGTVTVAL